MEEKEASVKGPEDTTGEFKKNKSRGGDERLRLTFSQRNIAILLITGETTFNLRFITPFKKIHDSPSPEGAVLSYYFNSGSRLEEKGEGDGLLYTKEGERVDSPHVCYEKRGVANKRWREENTYKKITP